MGFFRFLGRLFVPPLVDAYDETKRLQANLDRSEQLSVEERRAIADLAWNNSFRDLTGYDYNTFVRMDPADQKRILEAPSVRAKVEGHRKMQNELYDVGLEDLKRDIEDNQGRHS